MAREPSMLRAVPDADAADDLAIAALKSAGLYCRREVDSLIATVRRKRRDRVNRLERQVADLRAALAARTEPEALSEAEWSRWLDRPTSLLDLALPARTWLEVLQRLATAPATNTPAAPSPTTKPEMTDDAIAAYLRRRR